MENLTNSELFNTNTDDKLFSRNCSLHDSEQMARFRLLFVLFHPNIYRFDPLMLKHVRYYNSLFQ